MLLDNYPVSGLGSITTVAENAGVSTPTVARMVQKIGFRGFPDFQSRLHQELEATISNPISKHDRWAANAPGTHILNRFADATMNQYARNAGAARNRRIRRRCRDDCRPQAQYLSRRRPHHPRPCRLFLHPSPGHPLRRHPDRLQFLLLAALCARHEEGRRPDHVRTSAVTSRRWKRCRGSPASAASRSSCSTDQWSSPIAKSARRVFRIQIEAPSAWGQFGRHPVCRRKR